MLRNHQSPPDLLWRTLRRKVTVGYEWRSKTVIQRPKPEEREIWYKLLVEIAQIQLKGATLIQMKRNLDGKSFLSLPRSLKDRRKKRLWFAGKAHGTVAVSLMVDSMDQLFLHPPHRLQCPCHYPLSHPLSRFLHILFTLRHTPTLLHTIHCRCRLEHIVS